MTAETKKNLGYIGVVYPIIIGHSTDFLRIIKINKYLSKNIIHKENFPDYVWVYCSEKGKKKSGT